MARAEDVDGAVDYLESSLAGILSGESVRVSAQSQKLSAVVAAAREFENTITKIRKRYGSDQEVLNLCASLSEVLKEQ